MPSITLYQFGADTGAESGSPFCVKVHRGLNYKGLAYEVKNMGNPGELKKLNPKGKLPVLGYDGQLVTDSSRIFDFLEERHPTPSLWPQEPAERAQAKLLEDWADESLSWFLTYTRWAIDTNFGPFAKRMFGKLPFPLRTIVPIAARQGVKKQLWGQGIGRMSAEEVFSNLESHLQMLDTLLDQSPFLIGTTLTAADIAVFSPLKSMAAPVFPESSALIRRHLTVTRWLKAVDDATGGPHTVPFEL